MKKSNLFITTLLVVAAVSAAVVSCKKEKQETTTNNTELAALAADNMDEYLISFKKKLLSAKKGEETISLEQAQRDLGNLLNFDFGDANFPTNQFHYDTIHVSLNLSDGQVDLSQLAVVYNNAYAKVLSAYNQVELPEKSVFSISCLITQNAKDGESADVRLVLSSRGFIGIPYAFDTTDNWRVAERLGKCDGTCVGDDHASILMQAYNNNRPLIACQNGRLYYTDTQEYIINAEDFIETNSSFDYNYGFQLWCGYESEIINHCVDYQEMQYYFNNLCNILEEMPKPQGHIIKSIINYSLETTVSVPSYPEYFYYLFFYYEIAKPNCTDENVQF